MSVGARWQAEKTHISMVDTYAAIQGGGSVHGVRTARGLLVHCLSGHRDSTPSLHLVDHGAAHFFKAFCCGNSGDAADLVRFAGLAASFPEAVDYLAKVGLFQAPLNAPVIALSAGGGSRAAGPRLRNRRQTGQYDYESPEGRLLYRVSRIEGVDALSGEPSKTFEFYHPGGGSGDGCATCSLRLGRLLETARADNWSAQAMDNSVARRFLLDAVGARQAIHSGVAPDHAPEDLRFGADGIERVPYRLPDVLSAAERHDSVWFVEGEKKADLLRERGFAATSAPAGSQWRMPAAWAHYFRGARRVIIIPDCDVPGRVHCAQPRAATLQAAGVAAAVLDLDPGRSDAYDIADWLTERASRSNAQIREELQRLWNARIRSAPPSLPAPR